MDNITSWAKSVVDVLKVPLFTLGDSPFTLITFIYLVTSTLILSLAASALNKVIAYRLLSKSQIELGVRIAIGSIVKYLLLVIGFIIILQTAGINLSSLTILMGALGVGIGFGLQNITNNFVSGIIILLSVPSRSVIALKWIKFPETWWIFP